MYIQTGPEFSHRVFAVHIDFEDPKYLHCANTYAFHPNICYNKPDYEFCSVICREDLENTSSDYKMIMSLRNLIQNPNFSNPYNIDAAVMMRTKPEKFKAVHQEWKVKDHDPFEEHEEVEYVVTKVE